MSKATIPAIGGERRGRARSPAVIERRQAAIREASKEIHNRFTDAVQKWASYVDDDGAGPSMPEAKYYIMFKRLVHGKLGIPQDADRDCMSRQEWLAVSVMEEVVAATLQDAMAQRQTRAAIKARYKKTMDSIAAAHRPVLELTQSGVAS